MKDEDGRDARWRCRSCRMGMQELKGGDVRGAG